MSYTGVYTYCKSKERNEIGAIIKDLKGLKEALLKGPDFGKFLITHMIRDRYRTDEYPVKEYDTFCGFRSWKANICSYPNIERLAYGYSKNNDWADIFAIVSRFTEPFIVFHSSRPNSFPNLLDIYKDECDDYIFKATCDNGKVIVEKIQFSKPTIEKVYEEEDSQYYKDNNIDEEQKEILKQDHHITFDKGVDDEGYEEEKKKDD